MSQSNIESVAAPAAAPVAAPVDAPVAAPVDAPVAAPVDAPVDAPVAAPVDAPVAAPVVAVVDAPVDVPLTEEQRYQVRIGRRREALQKFDGEQVHTGVFIDTKNSQGKMKKLSNRRIHWVAYKLNETTGEMQAAQAVFRLSEGEKWPSKKNIEEMTGEKSSYWDTAKTRLSKNPLSFQLSVPTGTIDSVTIDNNFLSKQTNLKKFKNLKLTRRHVMGWEHMLPQMAVAHICSHKVNPVPIKQD